MKRPAVFLRALSVAALLCSFQAFAEATNCSGEIAVPNLTCLNPDSGNDVRLHITEFQTCRNDKIVEFERSVLGMHVLGDHSASDTHVIDPENVTIEYAADRTMIDPANRADNLSFIMPRAAKLIDGTTAIDMVVTGELEEDYEGAQSTHYKGSFTMTRANGEEISGRLFCFVSR